MPETLNVGTVVRVKNTHPVPEWRGKVGVVRSSDPFHPIYGPVVYVNWQIADRQWELGNGGPWNADLYLDVIDLPVGTEVTWATHNPGYWAGPGMGQRSTAACAPNRIGIVDGRVSDDFNVRVLFSDGCAGYIHVSELTPLTRPAAEPVEEEEEELCSHCRLAMDEDEVRHEVINAYGDSVMICDDCAVECHGCSEVLHPLGCETRRFNYEVYCDGCTNECRWCREWRPGEDGRTDDNGDWHCANCWKYCADCEEPMFGRQATDSDLCEDCQYTGCCKSPQTEFSIRNDGNGPLSNDTRTSITLGAGEISEEGLVDIYRLLRDTGSRIYNETQEQEIYQKWYHLAIEVNDQGIGTTWQTKEGNFTKRLSRHAYKKHGLKLPPEIISEIGNIFSAHSQGAEFEIEVTRLLNLPPQEFAHPESCWWQSYSESRCALKSNGGFGLRSFDGDRITGRAWVLPVKKTAYGISPTFNTLDPDGFIVFNGYKALSGYNGARVLAHMTGLTYRKIDFEASPMYINAYGYLVAPEPFAEAYTDGGVGLDINAHSSLFEIEQAEKIKKEMSNA